MATFINDLIDELKDNVGWQKTPLPLTDMDYQKILERAIRQLYVDTGRSSVYNTDSFVDDEHGNPVFSETLQADEIEYVLICAQLQFFKRVATDVNNIVGYVSDALTVTNADKPYANMKDTMDRLESERRVKYYKMNRFTTSGI